MSFPFTLKEHISQHWQWQHFACTPAVTYFLIFSKESNIKVLDNRNTVKILYELTCSACGFQLFLGVEVLFAFWFTFMVSYYSINDSKRYSAGHFFVDTQMRDAVTDIQIMVATHSQKAQSFNVPAKTAKIPVCFSRTSPCLCIWRRRILVSLLIRCGNWKTSLFTKVVLESYFKSCREAVKLNERRMLGTTGEEKP